MVAAHLLCLIVSCILWGLHMYGFFPHFCCYLISCTQWTCCRVESFPSISFLCLLIVCLYVSTDSAVPVTLFFLNISALQTACLHTNLSHVVRSYENMLWNVWKYSDSLLLSVNWPAKTCVVPPPNLNCCLMFLLALGDITALDFKQFLLKC